jgi:hypothetical protein
MEDIGDLIFYILAALFALFGAFNKKKKKAVAPRSLPDEIIDQDKEMDVKEVAERARERTREIIVSEDFSWDDETGVPDRSEVREWVVGENSVKDIVSRNAREKEVAYSDGEWVEPMAEMFSQEGISSLFEEEEKHIYDLDSDGIRDMTASDNRENREQSRASAIAGRFDLAEAIVFSEILKRRESF